MNIAIRADASQHIGTGHIKRCLNLADQLDEAGHHVTFICRDLPGFEPQIIENRGHALCQLPFSEQQKQDYAQQPISDDYQRWLGVDYKQDAQETIACLTNTPLDWLIVDHYGLDVQWHQCLRPHTERLMVIDDLANRSLDCDVLLDHNCYLSPELRYQSRVPDHCHQLLGPRYAIVDPRLKAVRSNRLNAGKPFTQTIQRIVVFMGGLDCHNLTLGIIQRLTQSPLKQAQIDVVVGSQNPNKQAVKAFCQDSATLHYHEEPRYYFELLEQADLAIGAGGVSALERALIGLWSIVFVLAENQQQIAHDLAAQGYAYWCQDMDALYDMSDQVMQLSRLNQLASVDWVNVGDYLTTFSGQKVSNEHT